MQTTPEKSLQLGPALKIGVLGGGQLGRMMIQSAIDLDVRVEVMDPSADAPCRHLTHRFVQGDLNDADAVFDFGKDLDVVTIEIEHVSVPGLRRLEQHGVRVVPKPDHLDVIQDKGTQKAFFEEHGIPTAPFVLVETASQAGDKGFPIVQKLRRGGYDGKGVQILNSTTDATHRAFDAPCVLEEAVDIDKELSVIVARNASGQTASFPVVESVFNPEANLVDYLIAPADIRSDTAAEAQSLALRVVEALNFEGLLAIELFLDQTGQLLVNELAPRTHNSGHHTIEANRTSQFEQHLRATLNLELGSTAPVHPFGAMVNLVGSRDATGTPVYRGLSQAMTQPGVHPHLYGKTQVKPFRKMGHVTVTAETRAEAIERVMVLREQLAVDGMSD
ncbi:MAG: 5-(carboxyamino)imidazole ribonucleotide synthase [Flavobacteriales bacterium]|nr:5-(carboxyamino)imidazole ribonucleotide synthase [Flavobacteriales bacterium]